MEREKSSGGAVVGAFVAGAATALIASGYLLYGPGGRGRRKELERRITRAKADLLDRMRKTKENTRESYEKIVDEVLSAVDLAKDLSDAQAQLLASRLKSRYRDMKKLAEESAEEARIETAELDDHE